MPGGRPPKPFKDEYCDKLIKHMQDGYSFESFGAIAGCGKDTLYRWVNEEDKYYQQKFAEAKKRGETLSLYWWEKTGMTGLWGDKNNIFNSAVWIFNMRNKFGWRDDPNKGKESGGEDQTITVKLAYDPNK